MEDLSSKIVKTITGARLAAEAAALMASSDNSDHVASNWLAVVDTSTATSVDKAVRPDPGSTALFKSLIVAVFPFGDTALATFLSLERNNWVM